MVDLVSVSIVDDMDMDDMIMYGVRNYSVLIWLI